MKTRWVRQSSGCQQKLWSPCLALYHLPGAAQLLHQHQATPLMPLAAHLPQQLLLGMTLQIWNPWEPLVPPRHKLLLVGLQPKHLYPTTHILCDAELQMLCVTTVHYRNRCGAYTGTNHMQGIVTYMLKLVCMWVYGKLDMCSWLWFMRC